VFWTIGYEIVLYIFQRIQIVLVLLNEMSESIILLFGEIIVFPDLVFRLVLKSEMSRISVSSSPIWISSPGLMKREF